MAIDATVGGVASNSYGTLAEAEAYFANHPDLETWDEAVAQEEALIWATIRLDEYDFVGAVATDTQALKWPRIDDDVFTLAWTSIQIPLRLKYAQFELALDGIRDAASGTSSTTATQPVSSLKIGSSVEVKYDTSGVIVDTSVDSTGIAIQAARFLKGLRLPVVLA